ncbi:DinB family protein [Pseudogemmatithrix spongiicola]|uniref:DinB family protein n=1 Tax=Pseudogemmatithrix spongiicola TaxID=3062599 RepID=A0AA49JXL2_9BACT|nr:DinB family protein [Gemmatimonadaceae bacterium 'strain 138']WKW13927.1 DinB family protein [Gemmatimonadaceae bacterium 'strain 318']
MSAHRRIRPTAEEFAPYYANYIAQVPDGDVVEALIGGAEIASALLGDLEDDVASRAYAPGKWTLKEVVLHCTDAERIFSYRALRIARGDTTPLPGFDENAYAPMSGANLRTIDSILDEFESVRDATVTLYQGLPSEAWTRRGEASGKTVSVRGIAWITAGHLLHHLSVIQDRYL